MLFQGTALWSLMKDFACKYDIQDFELKMPSRYLLSVMDYE